MSRPWVDNEEGPICSCGFETVVKKDAEGTFMLLCFFHTPQAGALFKLPQEAPDGWPDREIAKKAMLEAEEREDENKEKPE